MTDNQVYFNMKSMSYVNTPVINLEDLGNELKPRQLAIIFKTCMKDLDDVKDFVEELTDGDFDWLDQAVRSDFRV